VTKPRCRDEAALATVCNRLGDAAIPLVIDLLDPKDCASLLPQVLEKAGQLDILHANAGLYIGGDLVDADTAAIDRMLNLNINVVMKNVRDALPHMIARRTGDIIVTSSLAAHFPTPWEPVYASSKWAINAFVQGPSTPSCKSCAVRCSSTASASARFRPAR